MRSFAFGLQHLLLMQNRDTGVPFNTPPGFTVPSVITNEADRLQRLHDTPQLFDELYSQQGKERGIQRRLRALFDEDLVPAAIALTETRAAAAGKLPNADSLWLNRVGMEQSTAWIVAQHKAARFPSGETVTDLCSGIGVDTAALLGRGPVTSVDIDPAMSLRCKWNNAVWQQAGTVNADHALQVIAGDAHALELDGAMLHVDPDRRGNRSRPTRRLEHYCPNLEWMQNVTRKAKGGALKLGPASNFIQKFPGCEIELISLNGECREATVWFGSLASDSSFRATILPEGESIAADPLSAWCAQAAQVGDYICDPNPAVVRSGLLDVVGEMHDLQRLDGEDEYLTGESVPQTGFVKTFRVEATLPNKLKEIKRYLRTNGGKHYEVKCRHLHVDASAIQKKLPRGDGPPKVLFFIRMNGKARVVVAERLANP